MTSCHIHILTFPEMLRRSRRNSDWVIVDVVFSSDVNVHVFYEQINDDDQITHDFRPICRYLPNGRTCATLYNSLTRGGQAVKPPQYSM